MHKVTSTGNDLRGNTARAVGGKPRGTGNGMEGGDESMASTMSKHESRKAQ
jgi:hypothetical protein